MRDCVSERDFFFFFFYKFILVYNHIEDVQHTTLTSHTSSHTSHTLHTSQTHHTHYTHHPHHKHITHIITYHKHHHTSQTYHIHHTHHKHITNTSQTHHKHTTPISTSFFSQGVCVYVAPTKALVNQVQADIAARYNKSYAVDGKAVCGVFTKDWRYRVENCQVLVTVPG